MPGDLSKVVGYKLEDQPVAWNTPDLLLYAIGIGAKHDDYQFVYELDPKFAAVPTYPGVLPFKRTDTDVNVFAERFKSPPIPGMPSLNPNKIVHANQSVGFLKPLPVVSGEGWKWKSRYTGVAENIRSSVADEYLEFPESGIILTVENTLVDPSGKVYAKEFGNW